MSASHSECVVFLTHRWSARIGQHYARLKREASASVDVFLAYHVPGSDHPVPAGAHPDVVVTSAEIRSAFPARLAGFTQERDWLFQCADVIWVTATAKLGLQSYRRVWVVEYDVDYSGDWGELFSTITGYRGDLVGINLRYASAEPGWYNIQSYAQPVESSSEPVIGFFPFVGIGRELLAEYSGCLHDSRWQGHFEMVLPSVAISKGYRIEELGGRSPFTPLDRHDLHYTTPGIVGRPAATFRYRPPQSFRYFAESPRAFRKRDLLYHPVKSDLPLRDRLSFTWQRFGHRWVAFRNRLLGRG